MSIERIPSLELKERADVQQTLETFLETTAAELADRIRVEHADKPYHRLEHTETVVVFVQEVTELIKKHNADAVAPHEAYAAALAAWGHDAKVDAVRKSEGIVERMRGWEEEQGNEWKSFGIIRHGLEGLVIKEQDRCAKEDAECDPGYLGALNIAAERISGQVGDAIRGTIPEFTFRTVETPALATQLGLSETEAIRLRELLGASFNAPFVDQPYVTEESPLATLALALADLSQAGRMEFDDFLKASNGEFRELNYIVDEYGGRIDTLTDDEKTDLYTRYMQWSKGQVGFIHHQWQRFEGLIEHNVALNGLDAADDIKQDLRALYSNFKTNMEQQIGHLERLQQMYPGVPATPKEIERFYTEEILQGMN